MAQAEPDKPQPDGFVQTLDGVRVVEFDAIGPGPFCGWLLARHGAAVTRVTRPGGQPNGLDFAGEDLLLEGRAAAVALDLKSSEGAAAALALIETADLLIEGYRPGVMERLGLGPEAAHAVNPRLVYGRVTGFGQTGPLATSAGHDINYIALAGALYPIGEPDRPPSPPLALLGDFAGGGMLLGFGLLAGLCEARRSGRGVVVDAAMMDGAAQLMGMFAGLVNAGLWDPARGANILDGAAPFYRCYEAADGAYLAVGAIEPKFYAAMRGVFGLEDPLFDRQLDRAAWPDQRARIAEIVRSAPAAHWLARAEGTDACVTLAHAIGEASAEGHVAARGAWRRDPDGRLRPGVAPRIFRG